MSRIFGIQLRTTDVERARAFYSAVLASSDEESIVSLDAAAQARGARPHWLGFIDVSELGPALAALVAAGAQPLGKSWTTEQGFEAAVVRDPGGAVVALARVGSAPRSMGPQVIWHQLNTAQLADVERLYRERFGWRFFEAQPLPVAGVVNHPFAWQDAEAPVGAMADIAQRTGVHPHWLFHFSVPALDAALERLRAHGGSSLAPIALPNGARVAVCDDPQGAAFALVENWP